MAPPSSTGTRASAPARPWPNPGWRSRQWPRFFVESFSTWNAPFEIDVDRSLRVHDQAKHQVVDILESVALFPQIGRLERHLLRERQRDAGPHAIFAPASTAAVIGSLVCGKGLPDVVLNRERMRDHDSTAIAVDILSWSWEKPSDIHVADGDLELPEGESHGAVDAELVLPIAVGESCRLRRELIEAAGRNRVVHVAGSNRQKLCRPNREVHLPDRCFQVADVKSVESQSNLFAERCVDLQVARGREHRARSTARRRVPIPRYARP